VTRGIILPKIFGINFGGLATLFNKVMLVIKKKKLVEEYDCLSYFTDGSKEGLNSCLI